MAQQKQIQNLNRVMNMTQSSDKHSVSSSKSNIGPNKQKTSFITAANSDNKAGNNMPSNNSFS